MSSSFLPSLGITRPCECKISTQSISIGSWWWSGNHWSTIRSEPRR